MRASSWMKAEIELAAELVRFSSTYASTSETASYGHVQDVVRLRNRERAFPDKRSELISRAFLADYERLGPRNECAMPLSVGDDSVSGERG